MRGFASAQRAYENMEPANTECDCEELFECENCDYMALEGGECPKCAEDSSDPEDGVMMMESVERTEHYEGTLTDSRCDIHNHTCTDRHCCD